MSASDGASVPSLRMAASFSFAYLTCTDRWTNSNRAWMTSSWPGISFFALIRMCSRTPTFPKSCRRQA